MHDPDELASDWTEVGADYFTTLGIPLLRGREVSPSDMARGAQVCVINQSFLRKFFPGMDAIGRQITDMYPTTIETFQIIGVVADSKEHAPDEKSSPRFYSNISHPIGTLKAVTYLLRTVRNPVTVAFAVRESLRKLDRNLTILSLRTVDQQIDRRLITQRLIAPGRFFRSNRALDGGDWSVLRDVVFHEPANQRDRDPHGLGRLCDWRQEHGSRRDALDGRNRRSCRIALRHRRGAIHFEPAVWTQCDRSVLYYRCNCGWFGFRSSGRLCASLSRIEDRSDGFSATRLM